MSPHLGRAAHREGSMGRHNIASREPFQAAWTRPQAPGRSDILTPRPPTFASSDASRSPRIRDRGCDGRKRRHVDKGSTPGRPWVVGTRQMLACPKDMSVLLAASVPSQVRCPPCRAAIPVGRSLGFGARFAPVSHWGRIEADQTCGEPICLSLVRQFFGGRSVAVRDRRYHIVSPRESADMQLP
jgi:hypothetical protein